MNHQRKSVTVETTFASDLSLNQAEHVLNDLVKRLKLRLATNMSASMAIKGLVVKLKFYDFQCVSCELQYQCIDIHLYRPLLYKAYLRHNKMIRLLGVGVRFQQQGAIGQLALF
ncbi:DNA polymerase IV [Piscirickettsia salmonis]|uniref:DinB/UmuC family translesion DNA polymerase n=1 Tax=Piscirickettsia salmonis TaxID=1238 RepID=UPI0018ACC89A|nr:hypothetical protein [Piscirickettsia salmonis]QGP48733.1 DNA polymerase IV [Piscirickettsia salmonis]